MKSFVPLLVPSYVFARDSLRETRSARFAHLAQFMWTGERGLGSDRACASTPGMNRFGARTPVLAVVALALVTLGLITSAVVTLTAVAPQAWAASTSANSAGEPNTNSLPKRPRAALPQPPAGNPDRGKQQSNDSKESANQRCKSCLRCTCYNNHFRPHKNAGKLWAPAKPKPAANPTPARKQ